MHNKLTSFVRSISKSYTGVKRIAWTTEFELPILKEALDTGFFEKITDKMAEKCVNEMWKKYGAEILKKVDKKTIGNLTVKKLTTLIAKELHGR